MGLIPGMIEGTIGKNRKMVSRMLQPGICWNAKSPSPQPPPGPACKPQGNALLQFQRALHTRTTKKATRRLGDNFITRLKVLLINFHAVLIDEGLQELIHEFHNR